MEILEKLPGISVSRYQLLHREPSPKRYYSPGNRDTHSANQRRNDGRMGSTHIHTPPNRENSNDKFGAAESEPSTVPSTPLKSILKSSRATRYNSEQEMQTLQVLLNNLNYGNASDHQGTFLRARTPKTPYYQRHYQQYSAVNDGTDMHNKTQPLPVPKERVNSANTRQKSKSVSFKLDPKVKSRKSKQSLQGDWSVMVCSPAKQISSNITSQPRGVSNHTHNVPVFEEKSQSIREVVMNEIKQYYNTGNEKVLSSRTTVPSQSIRSKHSSSPSYRITPTSVTSQNNDLNHLHSLGDPYRRLLISRGTTHFGYDKTPPIRAITSTDTKIRRTYIQAKRNSKSRRNSYGGHITTNRQPSVEVS